MPQWPVAAPELYSFVPLDGTADFGTVGLFVALLGDYVGVAPERLAVSKR